MSQHGWYVASEVADLLGFKDSGSVSDLAKKGFLLTNNVSGGGRRYCKKWVDDLARLQENYLGFRLHDHVLYELYSLHVRYANAPDERSREEIILARELLVKSGRARSLRDLANALNVPMWRVRNWAHNGSLGAVKVGLSYYLSARRAEQVAYVWFKWPTVVELAFTQHIQPRKIWAWIERKGMPAYKFLDGNYRINPEQFQEFLDSLPGKKEGLLTVDEAVSRIGCDKHTFLARVCEGGIVTVGRYRELRIPEQEVARWEKWFKHLNDEFSWLEPVVAQSGQTVPTLYVRQVTSELGISAPTITVWAQQGLLPFYPGSFATNGHHTIRRFVRRYILGLRGYAGAPKVAKRHAVDYKRLCEEKGNIM